MVFGFLPLVAWLAIAAWLWFGEHVQTRRESLLAGALLATAWLCTGTEGLSALRLISFWPLLIWWLLAILAFSTLAWREARCTRRPNPFGEIPFSDWAWPEWTMLAILLFCLAWSFIDGFFSAPATQDALSYHLQRQVYWMQQHSVADYSTSNLRQLVMPPLAEYAGLHLMVLTGTDRGNNLIQWFAYLLAILAVSLIVRRCTPRWKPQLLAMVWVATVPMAFIQASNTKNDDVVMLWSFTALYYILSLASPTFSWNTLVCIGLSFGALLLAKGTGLIFGAPLGLLFLFLLIRRFPQRAVAGFLLVALLTAALNAPFLCRNYRAFGSPIPNDPAINGGDVLTNQDFSLRAIASNLARNIAPHLILPSKEYNEWLTDRMIALHHWLGIDINDPRTTYRWGRFKPYVYLPDYENLATATAQFAIVLLSLALLPWVWRNIPKRPALLIAAVLVLDFFLFSVLLKWQVWHVRLVVPIIAGAAPVVAWIWTTLPLRRVAPFLAGMLFVALLPSINTYSRRLLGPESIFYKSRDANRFGEMKRDEAPVQQIVRALVRAHPQFVGFDTGWNSEDYLLQRMLLERLTPPPRFVAFNAIYQSPGTVEPDPEIVISYNAADTLTHRSTGTVYVRLARLGDFSVYVDPRKVLVPHTQPSSAN